MIGNRYMISVCAIAIMTTFIFAFSAVAATECTPDKRKFERLKRGMSLSDVSFSLGCDGELYEEINVNGREQMTYRWDAYGGERSEIFVIVEDERLVHFEGINVKRNPLNW